MPEVDIAEPVVVRMLAIFKMDFAAWFRKYCPLGMDPVLFGFRVIMPVEEAGNSIMYLSRRWEPSVIKGATCRD